MPVPTLLRPLSAIVAATLLLAGCGPYNRGIASLQLGQTTELEDDQTDLVDGTYKGVVRVEAQNGSGCPRPQAGTIEIGDKTLFFAYAPSVFFISPIQEDGWLSGQAGDASLSGRVAEGRLQFTVTSPSCTVRYSFRYVV